MVLEIFQSQAETDASVGADDLAELLEIGRLAVSGQAHHFVLVAEFAEAQVLRHGRVIHAQGMGKRNRAVDVHAVAPPGSPHGAGEIAEAIRGEQRGLIERRNEKCAGQMRLVMLDAMILGANRCRAGHQMPAPALPRIPTNWAITLALSRAKLGILRAYRSFVPRRAQGLRGMAM